jgi:hypothetical protein
MSEPDPRLIKLVQQLDAERTRRVKAERKAATLQVQFAALKAKHAATKTKAEQRPVC